MRLYQFVVATLTVFLLTEYCITSEAANTPEPAGQGRPSAAAPASKREEPKKSDDESLPGTWKVVSVKHDGKKPSDDRPRMTKWIVNGERKAIVGRFEGDKIVTFLGYKLDPTTQPKSIDLEASHFPTLKGIYLLEGDRLTICYGDVRIKEDPSMPGGRRGYSERPNEFTSNPGSARVLIILQRETVSKTKADLPLADKKLVNIKPLVTIRGPAGRINGLAFSPDSKRLASALNPQTLGAQQRAGDVKIWDVATGKEVLALRGQKSQVVAVVFSPDGKRLAGACEAERSIRVWDTRSGEEVLILPVPNDALTPLAFSPDGHCIASAGGRIRIWDATSGKELLTMKGLSEPGGRVLSIAFSPDGKQIGAASDRGKAKIWDRATGKELHAWSGSYYVAFRPDGKRLAGSQLIWDASTGKDLRPLLMDGLPFFRADGQRIASVKDCNNILEGKFDQWSEVRVWETATSKLLFSLDRRAPLVYSLAFSPDGTRLALGAGDWYEDSEMTIWDAHLLEKTGGSG